jgi:hypothetical protein
MGGRRATLCVTLAIAALAGGAPAAAAPPENLSDDGTGKRWRQLTQTTGLTPAEIEQVCPRDGATRCSGAVGGRDLTGWIWATGEQVHALLAMYDTALLAEGTRAVGGPEHFGTAIGFLEDMSPTHSVTGYGFHSSFTGGWTSSFEEDGSPTSGSAGFGWYPIGGSLGVGSVINADPVQFYGVWQWRPSSDDITPPTITPTVSGTLGSNGWYMSDVSVT